MLSQFVIVVKRMNKGIKKVFDPNGILNSGKIFV